jgi:hypothetical protein
MALRSSQASAESCLRFRQFMKSHSIKTTQYFWPLFHDQTLQ